LRDIDGTTRLQPKTVYSLRYNYIDPRTKKPIKIYKKTLLNKIINLNEDLYANVIDTRKKDHYAHYRTTLENNEDIYNSRADGIFYFKITPPTEAQIQEDASADQAKQDPQQPLKTANDFGIQGTDEEIDAQPLPSPDTEPPSPDSVRYSFWGGGGKRRRRRQQGLKQNKLQTIKKYYKNK